jgi:hypothetical protein
MNKELGVKDDEEGKGVSRGVQLRLFYRKK